MGKTQRGSKELDKFHKMSHENKRLKREVAQLKKQIARLDLDRGPMVTEMISEAYSAGQQALGTQVIEMLKKQWECVECKEGYLEIIIYNKMFEPWYYRSCICCPHRTKAQKYDPVKVKGIIKESSPE